MDDDPRGARTARGVWLLAAGQTVGYAGVYYVFAAMLLTWDAAFDWGKGRLTAAFMLAILVSAVASPVVGRLIDRGWGRWVLSGGLALGAAALAALSTVQSYPAFLACWAVLGLAQAGSLYEPCFAFVTRVTGAESARWITRITLVAGFASTLAFPAAAVLTDGLGWRGAVAVFAAATALVAAPALYLGAAALEPGGGGAAAKAGADPDLDPDRGALRAAARRPAFWLLLTAFPLMALTTAMVLVHIVPILADAGLAPAQAVLVAAMIGPMQVAGRVVLTLAGGPRAALGLTALAFAGLFAGTLLLIAAGVAPIAAYAFPVVFGASYGVISILKPVLTAAVLGRAGFGAIVGVAAAPLLAATALAPQLGSALERMGGYPLALTAAAGSAALALAALGALALALRAGRA